MDELKKAREKYNSIEIPPELGATVREALENKKEKRKNLFVIKRALPLVACLALVAVAAFTGFIDNTKPTSSEEKNMPMPAAMARSVPVISEKNEITKKVRQLGETISLAVMQQIKAAHQSIGDNYGEKLPAYMR